MDDLSALFSCQKSSWSWYFTGMAVPAPGIKILALSKASSKAFSVSIVHVLLHPFPLIVSIYFINYIFPNVNSAEKENAKYYK